MTKKIKAFTCLAILAIIVAACIAIGVVQGKSIDVVENVVMSENTSDSIKIAWKEVKGAEGYYIYSLNEDSKEYEKLADVDGGENCSYNIENIEGGAVYNLKVTAFKYFNKKEYESEEAQTIMVYSMPGIVDAYAYSPEEGVLVAKWTEQANAAGYELEYSKNKDFSDAKKETLSENSFTVEDLKPNDIYYIRARSFIKINDKNVYGKWCEPCMAEIKDKIIMNPDIDPNKPIVAFSFDDGPAFTDEGSNSTGEILKVLEKYGARATFFMCGSRINDSNSKYLKKEIELGCELGNHTYDHTNYGSNVTADDIKKGSEAIKKASGQYPTIFRCPGGLITSSIQAECEKEGMPIAYWSVDPQDWKTRDADAIYKAVTDRVYDGSIVLMHDIYPTTAEAIKRIVPKLIDEGYQIVTVSEMLTVKNGGKAPKAGQQYVDYKTIN
ncbi:MAG: polysaccharide deacetylase family protein, partial [Eubacterium sp.]